MGSGWRSGWSPCRDQSTETTRISSHKAEHSPLPFLNICFMLEVFLSSVCTCFLFLSSNLLSWEERESLPRVAALLGEPGPFLRPRLKGEARSLFRGAGRDWRGSAGGGGVAYLGAAPQAEAGDQGVEVVGLLLGVVLPPALGAEARPGRVTEEPAARLGRARVEQGGS